MAGQNGKQGTRGGEVAFVSVPSVLKVFEWRKDGTLPVPATPEALFRKGISHRDKRTLPRALHSLGLADARGYPTEQLDLLAHAYRQDPETYRHLLQVQLRRAYAEVFARLGPELKLVEPREVRAAFAAYGPQSEQGKMVALFKGLCREAGLLPPGPRTGARRSDGTFAPGVGHKVPPARKRSSPAPALQEVRRLFADPAFADALFNALRYLQALPKRPEWSALDYIPWGDTTAMCARLYAMCVQVQATGGSPALAAGDGRTSPLVLFDAVSSAAAGVPVGSELMPQLLRMQFVSGGWTLQDLASLHGISLQEAWQSLIHPPSPEKAALFQTPPESEPRR